MGQVVQVVQVEVVEQVVQVEHLVQVDKMVTLVDATFSYRFSTSTTTSDPGSGIIRLNNSTQSSTNSYDYR